MIEAYKGDPTRHRQQIDKYQLGAFADTNKSMTIFKIRPHYNFKDVPFTFISPLKSKTPLYFKQSLDFIVNKRHSFGLEGESYRRVGTNISNFGLYYEYTNIHDSKIRVTSTLIGSIPGGKIQYHKQINQNKIVSLYGSSAISLRNIYSSVGIGFKYKKFQTVVTSRIGSGHKADLKYRFPVYKGITLKIQASAVMFWSSTESIETSTEVSLNYSVSKLKCRLINNAFNPDTVRFQFEARTSIGRIFICDEYVNQQNIIYLGLKRHNCQISIPIAATNSFAVTVLFGLAYLVGYFLKKDKVQVKQPKQQHKRTSELRLIEDKANDFYKKQEENKGLRVQSAYYGDHEIINKMYEAFQTHVFQIPNQPIDLRKVIDVTIPLRYYTQKGKIKLPKIKKSQLFGFCDIQSENPKLLIAYYQGESSNLKVHVAGQYQMIQI